LQFVLKLHFKFNFHFFSTRINSRTAAQIHLSLARDESGIRTRDIDELPALKARNYRVCNFDTINFARNKDADVQTRDFFFEYYSTNAMRICLFSFFLYPMNTRAREKEKRSTQGVDYLCSHLREAHINRGLKPDFKSKRQL